MRISVIGLGKLGCPLAALLASKGHSVVGADLSQDLVATVNAGKAPFDEPLLQDYLDQAGSRLTATTSPEDAAAATDVSMIIVPTPSSADGTFSNRFVLGAIEAIGRGLKRKDGYHMVVVISTVMPGSCEGEIRSALEAHSGRSLGPSLGLCYSPEFVALGSVFRNMLTPDMVLIGQSDPQAGDELAVIYGSVVENAPAVCRMNLVNAELTKISVNTYVTTKISYANMLSELCERLPGADVDAVTAAIGMDSRIGSKYLKGALGYGGPCFPRDNRAFSVLAQRLGAQALIAEATDAVNRRQVARLEAAVTAALGDGGTVAILGLSYKPDTPVIEESQSMDLARLLIAAGHRVVVYDPAAMPEALAALPQLVPAASAAGAAALADVVVIGAAWAEFKLLPCESLKRADRRVKIVDPWRLLPVETFGSVADVVWLGQG
jgi:UDPglucose 6-dehydrogenase